MLLYDSVDAYIADCQLAPNEVMAHLCTAIDYKDNDKLLEEHVNHMASNTLRSEGICVKLVTRPDESLPGVYVEDRNRNVLYQQMLDGSQASTLPLSTNPHSLPYSNPRTTFSPTSSPPWQESHFAGRCAECEV